MAKESEILRHLSRLNRRNASCLQALSKFLKLRIAVQERSEAIG